MSCMTQNQILLLSSRICSEILTPAVDGKFSIDDANASSLLSDALFLLQQVQKCPLIAFNGNQENMDDSSSQNQSQSQGDANPTAPKTKAHLIRTVRLAELKCKLIPLLLELRCMLENERSPVLVDVRHTLCAVLKPHRKQLNLVITDEVVRGEIEHLFSRQRESQDEAAARLHSQNALAKREDAGEENGGRQVRGIET